MKGAFYSWGEFEKEETISKEDLKEMRELKKDEMLAFIFREEDKGKTFYAPEEYIESDADGIAVKFSYAITK